MLGLRTWAGKGRKFLEEVSVRMATGAQSLGPHENGVESTREVIPLTGSGERLGYSSKLRGDTVDRFPPCTVGGMLAKAVDLVSSPAST